MDATQLAGFVSAPFVIGIVQAFKRAFPTASDAWNVGVALASAEVLSEAVAYVLHTPDPISAALVGLGVWLASMGAYSGTKTVLGK